ncbi:mitotic checkpoint regulator, MAD2B-interacting-domain-containing protein [Polychytrium aggregatum]|uniref:mitotic checkpoint regulator, MAD2B-interacting-domain-containing protein n=1 Tax=Polychytrium aggregatum TaxID=110093 RepID=UPI0022FEE872|nr:mitotic checkpoint regulator, MAD2B-interacting-domain-containing protein [Polychytrium aggregatum]KAI9204993.1 mitotic checkpoint regulator, MAD2B-interacting-domain-containing protein [Polychytrium aggregatum]
MDNLAGYGSSSDDEAVDQTSPVASANQRILPSPPSTKSLGGLALALPPPKHTPTPALIQPTGADASGAQKRKRVQIFLDVPQDLNEDGDEIPGAAAEKKPKSAGAGSGSGSGSGLFALLPPPKQSSASLPKRAGGNDTSLLGSSSLLVPGSVKKATGQVAQTAGSSKAPKTAPSKDPSGPLSFFTLESAEPKPDADLNVSPMVKAPSFVYHEPDPAPKPAYASAASMYAYPSSTQMHANTYQPAEDTGFSGAVGGSMSQGQSELSGIDDDKMIMRLGGRHARGPPMEIKEIRQQDIIGEGYEREIQKTMSLPAAGSTAFAGIQSVSKRVKSKHGIMSLAFEAKQREQALQEQYATAKATRKLTQAKYGF